MVQPNFCIYRDKTRMALGRAHTSARLNSLRFMSLRYTGSASGPEPQSTRLVLVTHPPQIHQDSSESVQNVLRYRAIYISLLALSLNGEESVINYPIQILIFTKIETISPCHTPDLSTKFRTNPSISFWDILLTNKQPKQTGMKNITSVSTFECGVKNRDILLIYEQDVRWTSNWMELE